MTTLVLSACAGNAETARDDNAESENELNDNMDKNEEESDYMEEGMDHSGMNHSSSGEVPENLAVTENPTYSVGSQAVMHANHMKGMDVAMANITGAFETTVYAVSYTPTTGGDPVEDHKWVTETELSPVE